MKDESSGSGSGVAMIVVAILGGLALVACCGGVAVVGAGMIFYRAARVEQEVMRTQDNADRVRLEFDEANKAMEEANEKLRQEMEGVKLPESPSSVFSPARKNGLHASSPNDLAKMTTQPAAAFA